MSKQNNVNPGQYKTAGREKPGFSVAAKSPKQPQAMNRDEQRLLNRPAEDNRPRRSASKKKR